MVEKAGAEMGHSPILQKRKQRLREVEHPDQGHMENLGGTGIKPQNSRLFYSFQISSQQKLFTIQLSARWH